MFNDQTLMVTVFIDVTEMSTHENVFPPAPKKNLLTPFPKELGCFPTLESVLEMLIRGQPK